MFKMNNLFIAESQLLLLSLYPVFYLDTGHGKEIFQIVGNNSKVIVPHCCSNKKIEVFHLSPFADKLMANVSIVINQN